MRYPNLATFDVFKCSQNTSIISMLYMNLATQGYAFQNKKNFFSDSVASVAKKQKKWDFPIYSNYLAWLHFGCSNVASFWLKY